MFGNISEEDLNELLEKAVYQQLFLGKDQIMGRMPQNTMHLKDIGTLITIFIQDIKDKLNLVNKDNLETFLNYFEKKFGFNLDETREKVQNNFAEMDDLTGQEIMVLYMVLTKLLENVRELSYIKFGLNRIKEEFFDFSKKEIDPTTLEKIQTLGATGDKDMSLLYNLCFLQLLANIYNLSTISTNIKRQITLKINMIIKKIID